MGYSASLFGSIDAASLMSPTAPARSGSPLDVPGAQARVHRLSAWLEEAAGLTRNTVEAAQEQAHPRHRAQLGQFAEGRLATLKAQEERLEQSIAKLNARIHRLDRQPSQEQFQEDLALVREELSRVLMAEEQVKSDVQQRAALLASLARS